MSRQVHVFDNGVRVYDDHLIDVQRQRYRKRNVHEAEEEDVFVQIVRNLPAEGCYVNIGCAIGYYPLLAKKLTPGLTIHAFEPLAHHRKLFAENAQLNGYDATTFAIHPQAVSAIAGQAVFRDESYGSLLVREATQPPAPPRSFFHRTLTALGVRYVPSAPVVNSPAEFIVETTTLDRVVNAVSRAVHLVQMDVQGIELEVLRGGKDSLRSGRIETLLIGTHGAEIHGQCLAAMEQNGYTIELSVPEAKDQPDGILVGSKGIRRLAGK